MPAVRADLVDVYVFREVGGAHELLQLRRTGEPMAGTWQPVMGHIEAGETAVLAAVRELGEEVGLRPAGGAWLGFWQLEEVHPYFVAALDAVVLSPRFAVQVDASWEPDLSGERTHDGHRWVRGDDVRGRFMWPGQVRACEEVAGLLATRGSVLERALRLEPPASAR
ncbi:MAG: NUDIX domain-containing protein [Phycisphaerales bacterium]|jgi:ADP-ribose pyrophosphatase YjhB (NUDIX family)